MKSVNCRVLRLDSNEFAYLRCFSRMTNIPFPGVNATGSNASERRLPRVDAKRRLISLKALMHLFKNGR